MVHNERVFLGIQRKVHQKPWMIFHSFHGGTFGEKEKNVLFQREPPSGRPIACCPCSSTFCLPNSLVRRVCVVLSVRCQVEGKSVRWTRWIRNATKILRANSKSPNSLVRQILIHTIRLSCCGCVYSSNILRHSNDSI